ncbi:hypothetical protein J7E62_24655 [Variovorax paradoxus]|nr:hypothetical protein [Variovorax paradoxus]
MALKKPTFEAEPTSNAAAADTGADTAVLERETPSNETAAAPAAAPAAAAPAAAPTAPAIVKTVNTAVGAVNDAAAKAKAFQKEFSEMKGASDFSFGNYRVFKGNNGSIVESNGDQDDLGRWVQMRMISWDEHFEISPGEQSASTKDYVAYSKDGKVIDSVIGDEQKTWVGKAVADYVAYLQDDKDGEGFASAKCRRFIDVGGALLTCENGDDAPLGTVIQITLSESSIPSFTRYEQELKDRARCVAMGIPGFTLPEDPFTVYFIRELASKGNNKWTKLKLSGSLPAKI